MKEKKEGKLYLYYKDRDILPTHAGFKGTEDLDNYAKKRSRLFQEKLKLPPALFLDSQVLEYGPDTGENALVFAKWGADVTLVEPNPNSWKHIRDYFTCFSLGERLKGISNADIQDYEAKQCYDFIDAEGFIHTVRPQTTWIKRFHQGLKEGGFFVISYYEAYGALFELFLKMIFLRAKDVMESEGVSTAVKLFRAKWNSIPHTRSFQSWVMDVLENPFTRLEYFINASSLYEKLSAAGFSLYSSWPSYSDTLSVYWHKKELSDDVKMERDLNHISRSCLSFVFGKKLFIASESDREVSKAVETANELAQVVDDLSVTFTAEGATKGKACLDELGSLLRRDFILADSPEDKTGTLQIIDSMTTILHLLTIGDMDQLSAFCNSDRGFINSWGMPCHFAVFSKKRNKEDKE